jgi:general secretion pathway protein J
MITEKSFGERGFTLVELQIAILIVALMAVLMTSALRLSSKTWSQVSAQQDTAEQRYLLAQYLRRHISNARFMQVTTEEYGTVTSFFGDEDQISFIAPYPAFHQNGELYWWNFKLEKSGVFDHYELVASYFPIDKNALLKLENDDGVYVEGVTETRFVIAENVIDLKFEYFRLDEEGRQQWLSSWQADTTIPLLIAININIPEENEALIGSPLPEIVIAPRFAYQKLHGGSFESDR